MITLRNSLISTIFFFPSQIGSFFGTIDSILMRTLVNSSLFTFKKTFDYQSLCDPPTDDRAAAGPRSVYVVSYISQTAATFKKNKKNLFKKTRGNRRSYVRTSRYLHLTYLLISPHRIALTNEIQTHTHTHMQLPSLGSHKSGREAEGMLKAVEWESQLQ